MNGVVQKYSGRIQYSWAAFVNRLDDAWAATQRAVGYTTEALSRTEDIDSFLHAVEPQARLTNLISGEVDEIGWHFSVMQPEDRNILRRWHHDRFSKQATLLTGNLHMAREIPDMNARWYKRMHRAYAVNPSLSNIVNATLDANEVPIRLKNIDVEVDVDGGDIFFASRRIRQLATDVVTNLISNAVKYAHKGGTVRIEFNDGRFSVEDEGIGMSAPFVQLLGKGYRVREMRAEGVDGFGFGWMTIGKALGKLRWRYAVETEPDVGSKFTVTMREDHLLSRGRVKPVRFDARDLFEILAQGNEILTGAQPLVDYHEAGCFLDVSRHPASWIIKVVRQIDAQYGVPN